MFRYLENPARPCSARAGADTPPRRRGPFPVIAAGKAALIRSVGRPTAPWPGQEATE
ncbi:MAG: hypothetical protein WCZ72_12100 [Gemmobacter sp.]